MARWLTPDEIARELDEPGPPPPDVLQRIKAPPRCVLAATQRVTRVGERQLAVPRVAVGEVEPTTYTLYDLHNLANDLQAPLGWLLTTSRAHGLVISPKWDMVREGGRSHWVRTYLAPPETAARLHKLWLLAIPSKRQMRAADRATRKVLA